jgi:uncharacterized protein (DUF1800 family)
MKQDAIKNIFRVAAGGRHSPLLTRLNKVGSTVIAMAVAVSLGFGGIMPAVADTKAKAAQLTEEQKIIHLLNRIGYGPRPGDSGRVKRMGIDKYIGQQLHPERLDDSATEARLLGLDSLRMSVAEIYEQYPEPAMIARELGLRGPGQANQQTKSAGLNEVQAGSQSEDAANQNQREGRRPLAAYYSEHGLKFPQTLLQELEAQKIIRAVYSQRQLQEVMTDFWFNHFNIYWGKGADRWLATDFEMNAIRPHALGKFKDLLMATAKSPAMMFYLDNYLSASPDAKRPDKGRWDALSQRRPGPVSIPPYRWPRNPLTRDRQIERPLERDQISGERPLERDQVRAQQRRQAAANRPRQRQPGINENYARELMELHTLGVDGGYTQKDVQEVARCFTGWTIEQPRQRGTFVFRDWMHDDGEKIVLGHHIPAGGGIKDGEQVIDILAHHPSTAKFISTMLARRFVSDDPPPSLVDRVASVYMKTDGDIRQMLMTIFTSHEFYSPEAYRAKIKSPFELTVSAIRALGGDTNGSPILAQAIAKMGEPLYQYQPPTGFPDRANQWVNAGALLERLNFGLALSGSRIPGTTVDLRHVATGVDGSPPDRVMDCAIAVLLSGDVSPQTRAVFEKQLKEGVPVKGELSDSSRAAVKPAGAEDLGDAMTSAEAIPARPAGKAARQDRRALRDWGVVDNVRAPLPPMNPQIATTFGLVLGSPEFQRR